MKAQAMATVLVVDDETPIIELLIDIIEEEQHRVLHASNGKDGLELARKHHPDLIISDVMMPLLDGYALLQALRSDPATADLRIFLMSAAFPQTDTSANEIAADGYIHKPFDITVIEDLLQRFL